MALHTFYLYLRLNAKFGSPMIVQRVMLLRCTRPMKSYSSESIKQSALPLYSQQIKEERRGRARI
eukprot:12607857-Ditylum_brightwellii.AAC.1